MTDVNPVDPNLLELFKQETETHIHNINQVIVEWEENITDTTKIEQLMRAAHSLKGAARIIGLTEFSKIAHLLEDCFVNAQKGIITLTTNDFDTILQCIDFLSQVSHLSNENLMKWPGNQADQLKTLETAIINITQKKPPAETKETPTPKATINKITKESPIFTLFKNEALTQIATIEKQLDYLKNKSPSFSDIQLLETAANAIKGASQVAEQKEAESKAKELELIFLKIKNKENTLDAELNQIRSHLTYLSNINEKKEEPTPPPSPSITPPSPKQELPEKKLQQTPPPVIIKSTEHTPTSTDHFVRISALNLNRLMSLAAESLIETRHLDPLKKGLLHLKVLHGQLVNLFNLAQKVPDTLKLMTIGQQAEKNLNEYRTVLQTQLDIFDAFSKNSSLLSTKLYNEVLANRMRPFSEGIQAFPLLVRNLARSLGKKITLEITGKETQVDRDILEKLEAPLNHIIRNACDHGIETPELRLATKKNEKGTIKINARHSGGMLIVTIDDDGNGINRQAVIDKVISKNLLPKELIATLNDDEILDFLFLPGFSTAKDVTDISGRGVGLDVVQKTVQEISGKVTIDSELGKGTTITLQLPITRSVLRALSVEINNEPYAIPLSRIDQILRIKREEIHTFENRDYFHFDDKNVAVFSASQVLGLNRTQPSYSDIVSTVILRVKENVYSLVVDKILTETELVVRPLDAKLGKIPCVAATSITDEGIPIIILDVEDILKYIEKLLIGQNAIETFSNKQISKKQLKKILIVDDSLTVRETERRLLENAGFAVEIAVDGADGWNAVRTNNFDLVITDIDMPRLNGFELVNLIKNDQHLKNIPVIIISYKDRGEDKVHGLEAGADYYLTKSSFKDQTFINAVKDLIGEPIHEDSHS